MSYGPDNDYPAEGINLGKVRARPRQEGGAASRLDRLEKALHGQEQALTELADGLGPLLAPEQPSPVDGMVSTEPASELSARLDRMGHQAEAHLGYIRALTRRIDL